MDRRILPKDSEMMEKLDNTTQSLENAVMTPNLINLCTYTINDFSIETVNARDLHLFLNVAQPFDVWINSLIEQYYFELGNDYFVNNVNMEGEMEIKYSIYLLTLDMAKTLSILERSDKGRTVRKYLIEYERKLIGKRSSDTFNLYNNAVK